MSTPFMGLILPVPTVTPGPTYATENNTALTLVDSHDHSTGKGTPIPSNGISLNADLPFNNNNATLLRSTRYTDQGSALALVTDVGCMYIASGNLYYNNGIGQAIQLTAGAALNATSIGGIGGDYGTSTASLFYTSASSTFTFWSNANISASLDGGPITIRENILNANGITISSPTSLAANYGLQLPTALPAALSFLTLDTSGNIAAPGYIDGVTLSLVSGVFKVADSGVNTTQIATNAVTPAKLSAPNLVYGSTTGAGSGPPSGGFSNITSVSIAISGVRPVAVSVQWDGVSVANAANIDTAASTTFKITGTLGDVEVFSVTPGRVPPGGFFCIDNPITTPQTVTYTLSYSSAGSVTYSYIRLVAYEL